MNIFQYEKWTMSKIERVETRKSNQKENFKLFHRHPCVHHLSDIKNRNTYRNISIKIYSEQQAFTFYQSIMTSMSNVLRI